MFSLFHRATTAILNLVDPYVAGDSAPTANVWHYIRSHVRPLKPILLFSLICTVLAAGLEVWLISYAGQLIDMISATPTEQIWQAHGWNLLLAALVVLLLRPLLQFARHAANDIGLDCNIANLVRWRAHEHLVQQSVGWFQEDLTGRTTARLIDIGNYTAAVIYESLNIIAFGLVYVIGIVTVLAGADMRLAVPLFIWLVLYIALILIIIPRMVKAQRQFQSARSALVGRVVDCFANFDLVKLFSSSDTIAAGFKTDLEATRQRLFVPRQLSVGLRTLVMLLEGMMTVGLVGYGIWLWSVGGATIGLIASTLALTFRITALAEWVIGAVWIIFRAVGSLGDALKTIAQPLQIPPQPDAPALVVSAAALEMKDLHHQYGTHHGGVSGISLSIARGEKIGIVGASGAGKSTLVNLILRFFEAERGEILIDGQNIREVEQDSLRAAIGLVSQQASLLNRSVRENIALGRETISDAEIEAAAKQARAHEFILALEDKNGNTGYAAHVGERGIKLSGGQRQRIALARVILKDAPILILDEATSALDSKVEADIQAALQDVMRDKTVIAIAHRLSTIAQMDRIIVLQEGRIVEQGNHDALLAQQGLYAEFWRHQSGEFLGV